MSPTVELQKSIYTAVSAVGYSTYDDVPTDAVYPYVVIGDDTLVDDSADDTQGLNATVTVHSFSSYRGKAEIKKIQDDIFTALDRVALPITGYVVLDCLQEFAQTFLDQDGITRHGVQRFRVNFYKQ